MTEKKVSKWRKFFNIAIKILSKFMPETSK